MEGPIPSGTARVVVIDERGDEHEGALTDVPGWPQLVRFEDASGAVVPQPLPDGPRTPVDDAPEPCPACAAVAWVKVGAVVVCERCGHVVGSAFEEASEHGHQTSFHYGPPSEDEPVELVLTIDGGEHEFDFEAYERERVAALAAVPFPVYAVPGCARSAHRHPRGEVVVGHRAPGKGRELSVTTGPRGAERDEDPRDALHLLLDDEPHEHGRSLGARLIASAHLQRQTRRSAMRAEPVERALVIDGQPEPFTVIVAEDAWVATREHGDLQLLVSARGFPPNDITLEPLADLANAEAGTVGDARRATERARRDAAGELLTVAEVDALIERHGLASHRDAVLAAIRPGYWLLPGTAPRTRIGGLPDLAPGEQWPHDEDGIPHTFVAQIDTSALPPVVSEFPLPEWGHGGALVRIFAPLDARIPEPYPAVALACPPDAPVARAALPPRPDPMPADAWEPDDDLLRELHEQRIHLVPFLSARTAWYAGIPPALSEAYEEFGRWLGAGGEEPPDHQWQLPHLLGHGTTMQGEESGSSGEFLHADVPRDAWRTLINLPLLQDVGVSLTIAAPAEDLAAGRYDRLVVEVSMD